MRQKLDKIARLKEEVGQIFFKTSILHGTDRCSKRYRFVVRYEVSELK